MASSFYNIHIGLLMLKLDDILYVVRIAIIIYVFAMKIF